MLKFKQKEFLAPVIAAALIGGAGTGASIISGKKQTAATNESQERIAKMQAAQAKKEQKAQEEEAKKERDLQEKQLKAAQKQEKDLIRLAKRNPQAAAAVKPTATVTATVTPQQQQPQQAMFSMETVTSVIGAGGQIIGSRMQLKATREEAKGNIATANANLGAATQESKARIAEATSNASIQKQELKNKAKEFKANTKIALAQAKQQQKAYSMNPNTKKEALGFAKNIKQLAADRGVKKGIMATAVGGATVVGAKYLVDKAIQKDIKKSGLEKVNEETPEQIAARKKAKKRAVLLGLGTTAAAVGAGVAAKKGAFGNKAQNWASTNLTKTNFKNKAISAKDSVKNGFLDAYTTVDADTGKRSVNKLGVGLTAAGVALPAAKYAMTKRAYKKQIKQSEGEQPEDRNYSKVPTSKPGANGISNLGKTISGFFKKGTTATSGGIKPKVGGTTKNIKLNLGKGKGTNAQNTVDNRRRIEHFKSGIRNSNPSSSESGGGIFSGLKEQAKSGFQEFKKAPGQVVLGKISERKGGGGRKGVAKFGEDLENLGIKNNNTLSQKAGKFIKENPKTALAGSIGVGIGIAKVGGLGEKAATKAIKAVDKNAFAYQERGTTFAPKGQPVKRRQQEQEEEEGEN